MRYAMITASILSLLARGMSADTLCEGGETKKFAEQVVDCPIFEVPENKAWRANCGWGLFDWSKGNGSGYGLVTMSNLKGEKVFMSWTSTGADGSQRHFLYTIGPYGICDHSLDIRASVTKVMADIDS
ncbi:hypothetical protein BUE80_DR000942 [Diplocarpon rosae]|nr:hypothetical protein BUE80_DR000942 [Diplocarpon rosae]